MAEVKNEWPDVSGLSLEQRLQDKIDLERLELDRKLPRGFPSTPRVSLRRRMELAKRYGVKVDFPAHENRNT